MIEVTQLVDDSRDDHVFEVEIMKSYQYTVWFSENCYQELTAGKIDTDDLVRKSFEFLLKQEPASSILPEFNLTQISRHFPKHRSAIKTDIENT